jgi:hypothetical protein
MTIAASPFLPEIDAHLWRGLRRIEGQIKLGVMMRRTDRAPRWVGRLLNLLVAEPAIKLDVVYRVKGVEASQPAHDPLFHLLQKVSEKHASPLVEVPLAAKPACCFVDIEYAAGHGFTKESRKKIIKRQLDVLLWLDEPRLLGDASGLARLDVWSFRLGDPAMPLSDPPYWKEVVNQTPVSQIALLRHPEHFETGMILVSHQAPTQVEWRFTLNAEQPTWMAGPLLIRSLLDALSSRLVAGTPAGLCEEVSRQTLTETTRFIGTRTRRSLEVRTRPRAQERWFAGIRAKRNSDAQYSQNGFTEIPKPAGSEYADPFIFTERVPGNGGRNFLFFEEVPSGLKTGRIAALEVVSAKEFGPPFTLLEKSHHLSYPFVFRDCGETFLIVESAADRTVPMYRARHFPEDWDHAANLVEGIPVTDTTPFHLNGAWFFFTSTREPGLETLLFYTERLDGEWRYHPANPICSDARRARGAGALFYRGNRLIRPSQDCSVRYGHAIVLNEIVRLTTTEYAERPLETILPDWQPGLLGTHTLNSNECYEVIDGLRLEKA